MTSTATETEREYQIVLVDHDMGIALSKGTTAEEALANFLAARARGFVKRTLLTTEEGGASCTAEDGTRYYARPLTSGQ